MLGSLARWLRIGGVDSEYMKDTDDDLLIEEATRDGLVLLTRDEELARRARKRGVDSFYVPPGSDAEALRVVASKYSLSLDPARSRCPKCNGVLRRVGRDEVEGLVPEGTFRNFSEFWRCEMCGGVYWRGSHWAKISETIVAARPRDRES